MLFAIFKAKLSHELGQQFSFECSILMCIDLFVHDVLNFLDTGFQIHVYYFIYYFIIISLQLRLL